MFRFLLPLVFLLTACVTAPEPEPEPALPLFPGETAEVRALVNKWADFYNLPRTLVHRVIQRESDYRAAARSGPYYGMMQILPATARNMGMVGEPSQLLNADKGLKYSIRYLRGAWMVSDGDEREAMLWYAKGYYFEAKERGLLRQTGLRGGLWQRFDAGEARMPAIDAQGRLIPQVVTPDCRSAAGFAGVLGAETCS